MSITRTQVDQALTALGVDPVDTRSVSVAPMSVFVETVVRDDTGVPVIEHGQVRYQLTTIQIEEVSDVDADA